MSQRLGKSFEDKKQKQSKMVEETSQMVKGQGYSVKGKIKRKILKFAFYDGIKVIPALLIIVKIFYTIMLSLIPSYFDKHKNYLLQSQILLKCKKKKPPNISMQNQGYL